MFCSISSQCHYRGRLARRRAQEIRVQKRLEEERRKREEEERQKKEREKEAEDQLQIDVALKYVAECLCMIIHFLS